MPAGYGMIVTVHLVGSEEQPVIVIDDFMPDPETLRAEAAAAVFEPGAHHYPGVRAPLSDRYLPQVVAAIAPAMREAFGLEAPRVIDASFSIVTSPPADLTVRQRLPHCDAFEPERIAMVHYLGHDRLGGTAFFRHRSTGFETIDEVRAPVFFGQVDAELRHGGLPPARYVDGDNRLFERIWLVETRFNRAVLYRSALLHSGAIAPDAALSSDPMTGRLTVTAFFAATRMKR